MPLQRVLTWIVASKAAICVDLCAINGLDSETHGSKTVIGEVPMWDPCEWKWKSLHFISDAQAKKLDFAVGFAFGATPAA